MTRSSSNDVDTFLKDLKKKDHESRKKGKKAKKKKHHKKDERKKKRKRDATTGGTEADKQQPRRKKHHRNEDEEDQNHVDKRNGQSLPSPTSIFLSRKNDNRNKKKVTFDHRYILAPMVGASELAFRLLCRKYGAQLAYTPMMSARQFSHDAQYRRDEFFVTSTAENPQPHVPGDRPLVCHFSANTPQDFAAAAKMAQPYCDAIDLNLGCPQRTAFIGHFGSYLLDPKDRQLVCDIVRAAADAVDIPMFTKIRLLPTLEETIQLCRQLADAGASLIAIHARYRASWERKGPGARDGPALLDQVLAVKQALAAADDASSSTYKDVLIVANGNTITYDDVENNLQATQADGLMSAEGILDNPALFLPRLGSRQEVDKAVTIPAVRTPAGVAARSAKLEDNQQLNRNSNVNGKQPLHEAKKEKRIRKLNKKLREIARIEKKMSKNKNASAAVDDEEKNKLHTKESIQEELRLLLSSNDSLLAPGPVTTATATATDQQPATSTTTTLGALYESSDDKIQLAMEYLDLATVYPVKMRSVIFHIRRMLKDTLTRYQLLEECLAAPSIEAIRAICRKMRHYQDNPASFTFDQAKAQQEKDALERKRREEGKRKRYEERMIRKAKREGRTGKDLFHYLQLGSTVPSLAMVQRLRTLPRNEALRIWQEGNHAQHCLAFHLDDKGCARGRACAFLHVDIASESSSSSCHNSFVEKDEVAG